LKEKEKSSYTVSKIIKGGKNSGGLRVDLRKEKKFRKKKNTREQKGRYTVKTTGSTNKVGKKKKTNNTEKIYKNNEGGGAVIQIAETRGRN